VTVFPLADAHGVSVVIKGPCFFWRPNFKLMLYSVICWIMLM